MTKKKTTTWPRWASLLVVGLFSISCLAAGIPKVLAMNFMVEEMARLGFSTIFTQFIGLCWILAGIGVWLKPTRALAALLTFPIVFGAIAAHLAAGDAFNYLLIINLLLPLLVVEERGAWKGFAPFLN